MNRLLVSIETIQYVSQAHFKLPSNIIKFYQNLYGRYKHDPSARIEQNLNELEQRIKRDLDAVLRLVTIDDDEFIKNYLGSTQQSQMKVWEGVSSFKRRLQTMVSLRLILKERGIPHKQLQLSVPNEEIESHIRHLEDREHRCVDRMKDQINTLVSDIDSVLINIDENNEVAQNLISVRLELIENLNYLNSGKSIDQLPHLFEVVVEEDEEAIESVSNHIAQVQSTADIKPAQPTVSASSRQEYKQTDTLVYPQRASQHAGYGLQEKSSKQNWFTKFWRWLNSPVGVKWKNIDKD